MNREFSLRREFRCQAFLIFHLLSVVFVSAVQAGSVPDYVAVNLRTGEQIKLSQHFRNDVLLIVHIPMDCEGKNQFQGLQKLYQRYRDKGFVVLGLLTNGFGPKGPNKAEHFLSDCIEKYQFSFPVGLLENQQSGQGDGAFFQWLGQMSGKPSEGYFSKYLIDREWGRVKGFGYNVRPDDIKLAVDISRFLERKKPQGKP